METANNNNPDVSAINQEDASFEELIKLYKNAKIQQFKENRKHLIGGIFIFLYGLLIMLGSDLWYEKFLGAMLLLSSFPSLIYPISSYKNIHSLDNKVYLGW